VTNPAIAIVNSRICSSGFEAKQDNATALSHDRVRSSEQDRHCRCKLERPEDYSAASCSEQPSTAILRGVSSIDYVDWKDENNELDC
jgi:hypothetical protein